MALRLFRLVSVPADDEIEFCSVRAQAQFIEIVQHVETGAARVQHRGERQVLRPSVAVDIASHGKDRRDAFQLVQDFRTAYITSVDNEVDAAEGAFCLWAQKTMSVRDDSDSHLRILWCAFLLGGRLILFAVFLRHILFGDFPGVNFGLVRVRGIFNPIQNLGLERLSFFQQLFHAL